MAKSPKKTPPKPKPDVAKELAEALAEGQQEKRTRPSETPLPQVGDRVTFTASKAGLVYEINRVSDDGREVDLHFPGTNLERFRVNPDELTFVERREPARPRNQRSLPLMSPNSLSESRRCNTQAWISSAAKLMF